MLEVKILTIYFLDFRRKVNEDKVSKLEAMDLFLNCPNVHGSLKKLVSVYEMFV